MALRALMLEKELRGKKAQLEELRKVDFAAREAKLEKAIDEASTAEDRAAVDEAVANYEAEQKQNREQIDGLEKEITEIENKLSEIDAENAEPEKKQEEERKMKPEEKQQRGGILFNTTEERRNAILNSPETKEFVENIRTAAIEKRAISNVGLTIPTVMLDLIRENVMDYSKLLRRVRVRSINGDARQLIAGTVPEAVWTEMCGNLNELSFGFSQVTIDGYKVGGYIAICNAILQDSFINLASEIITMLSEAIGHALDKAILYGLGAAGKMPLGIVTRLAQTAQPTDYPKDAPVWTDLHVSNIQTIASTTTGQAFFQAIIGAMNAIFNPYARGNLFWAMNSATYNRILAQATTFDASGSIVARVNGVMPIVGGDIVALEFIPDGDIIGGYGDLYLLGERRAMEIASSDQVMFLQDNTVFKATARYDGLPVIPKAFTAININGGTPTTEMNFAPDFANLSVAITALSAADVTITPTFNSSVTSYTGTTTAASGKITATPQDPNATVNIYVNGAGVASDTPTWKEGRNVVLVNVKNGLNEQNYSIIVEKKTAAQAKAASK